jgi:CTP:molybdopterin cytidylyltransferase MocA
MAQPLADFAREPAASAPAMPSVSRQRGAASLPAHLHVPMACDPVTSRHAQRAALPAQRNPGAFAAERPLGRRSPGNPVGFQADLSGDADELLGRMRTMAANNRDPVAQLRKLERLGVEVVPEVHAAAMKAAREFGQEGFGGAVRMARPSRWLKAGAELGASLLHVSQTREVSSARFVD